jgi:transposase
MAVFFGVDSHKRSFAISAIDEVGRELARAEFANTPDGHRSLIAWALERGESGRFGVEGSGGLGRALAQELLTAGLETVDVPGALTDRERRRLVRKGKSDPQDALAIARVTLRETTLEPLTQDGTTRELKLLCDYREQLCSQRTRVQNRLHADLVVLAPGYEKRCPNLVAKRHLEAAARVLRNLAGVQAELARKRLHSLRRLDREIVQLEQRIEKLVTQTATGLTSLVGIGPLGAARVLGEVRDIRRYASKDRFASANGTAPIPASSGAVRRHRLNRGGNRRLNRVIHTMALVQIRCDPRARAYIERRRSEGKTYRDAIRSLKRHLSDVIYKQLREDTLTPHTSPP